jgi:BTB/POZ domain
MSTTESTNQNHAEAQICSATARSMDPDVTVIVGNVAFQEYSVVLCCLSEYFDGAFSSGMKESSSRSFSFPDQDPKEWELLMSVFGLNSDNQIDKKNVSTLMSWCDELCMTKSMKKCEAFYYREFIEPQVDVLMTKKYSKDKESHLLSKFYCAFQTCIQYNMEGCIRRGCELLRFVFEDKLDRLSQQVIEATVDFLKRNNLFFDCMWDKFEQYIPSVPLCENEDEKKGFIRDRLCPKDIRLLILDDDDPDPLWNASAISVQGAGSVAANGDYYLCGKKMGFCVYVKEGEHSSFWLSKESQNSCWFLEYGSGEATQIPQLTRCLYKSRAINRKRLNPPTSNDSWVVWNGKSPGPSIFKISDRKRTREE